MCACSLGLKSEVGSGPRILSLRVYDRESFTSFHVQAVVPVILVKPIDTSQLAPLVQRIVLKYTRFQLKIKEAMHIHWEQPSLNSIVKHSN